MIEIIYQKLIACIIWAKVISVKVIVLNIAWKTLTNAIHYLVLLSNPHKTWEKRDKNYFIFIWRNCIFRKSKRFSQSYLKWWNFGELPWWLSGKESTCQCSGRRFDPWSGKIPCASEQLSPCATTIVPGPSSLGPTTREATTVRSPHTETRAFHN